MDNLTKNLNALDQQQPALASALRQSPDLNVHLVDCQDGGKSVRALGAEGPWVQSRRNPIEEGVRLAGSIDLKMMETTLLMGMGLGYTAAGLFKRDNEALIAVFEPNLPLIKTALQLHDFSHAINQKRMRFAMSLPGMPFGDAMEVFMVNIPTFGFHQLSHSYTLQDRQYTQLYEAFAAWLKGANVAIQTGFAGAIKHIGNALNNAVYLYQSVHPAQLEGTLENLPAVLLAAGPSLGDALEIVKANQDRLFIAVVSTALKRVLAEGIRVDLTCVADYSHLSQRYFRELPSWPPIVSSSNSHPLVLDGYEGVKVLEPRPDHEHFLGGIHPAKDRGRFGASNVSQFLFLSLLQFGVKTLAFAGMDQAYSYHVCHVPGAATYDEASGAGARFTSLYMKDMLFFTCRDERVDAGLDPAGNPVITDRQMDSYAGKFEEYFTRFPEVQAFNASGAGRQMRGSPNISLAEFIKSHAPEPIDLSEWRKKLEESQDVNRAHLDSGFERIARVRRASKELLTIMRRANSALEKASSRMEKKGETGDLSIMHELNDVVEKHKDVYNNISELAASDLMERRRLKQQSEDPKIDLREKARLQIKAELAFTGAYIKAVNLWLGMLDSAERRLQQAKENKALTLADKEVQAEADAAGGATVVSSDHSVDALIEMSQDAETRAAFVGEAGGYSPLAMALKSMLSDRRVRHVVVPRRESDPPLPLSDQRIVEVAEEPITRDIPTREDGRRLMAFQQSSNLYGPLNASALGLHSNPFAMLAAIEAASAATNTSRPGFILNVPGDSGFLCPEAIEAAITGAALNQWTRPVYLFEGPQGLFPFLWETNSVVDVANDQGPLHMVYWQQQHFWGDSFLHMPSRVRACHRNFSLSTKSGRAFCQSLAKELSASPSLNEVIAAADMAYGHWRGEFPIDLEIEITTTRRVQPRYLPRLGRMTQSMSLESFQSLMQQIGEHGLSVALTLGGHGDPLEHPKIVEFVSAARPHVRAINLRTFGQGLTGDNYNALARAGVDIFTLRLGAWGPEQYNKLNGFEGSSEEPLNRAAGIAMQLASAKVQQGQQLPLIIPEVVKSGPGDRTLIQFRDAWWSPVSFPMVAPIYDYDGAVDLDGLGLQTNVRLRPGIRKPPHRLFEQMVIYADGSVPGSIFDFDAKTPMGAVLGEGAQSIREVWTGEAFEALRQKYIDEDDSVKGTTLWNEWCHVC